MSHAFVAQRKSGALLMLRSQVRILSGAQEIDKTKICNFDSQIKESDDYFYHTIGSPKIIEGPEVTYLLNKNGFRSEDFDTFNTDNFNILFGGDSWTFGDSLPVECVYPYMISNELSKRFNKEIKHYNTGINGSSVRQVVKNTVAFIRKYGNPDFIFLLIPISSRDIVFDEKNKVFERGMHELQWVLQNDNVDSKSKKRYYEGFNAEESLLLSIDLMHMLEDICSSKNIKFIWSTYDGDDGEIYEECGFSNFVALHGRMEEVHNIDNLPYWDMAKDNIHPGARYHAYATKVVLQEFIK
jgi:hypothetical protein